ncbi:CoA transferase [Xanthobacter sp. KR7-225]|uniref:CaiB/BaiF CoA-transferase family protein n=1 Tax=Xanthobacter sp. KR7-225 TaxID=3156613 RepID=UPI0032B3465D
MTITTPFADLVVLEWGRRTAVRACGSLLAQVGARVIAPSGTGAADGFSAFKEGIADTPQAREAAFARANVVLVTSDRADAPAPPPRRPDQIVVDITVDGDPAHGDWIEPFLQAATGIADITGIAGGPPVICGAAVIEIQTGMFAASGILAAWRMRAATGAGQDLGLRLLDCGLNGQSTFLPLVFAGRTPGRSGNRHPMAVPWNSYRAADGWILLCSATDEHWVKLAALMGRPELAGAPYEKLADRIALCDAVDREVEAWTATLSVKDCVAALNGAGLAAGPILSVEGLKADENLRLRGALSGGPSPWPLSFVRTDFSAPAAGRPEPALPRARPLDGLLVLEIGQYTTAPLAAKQLALLGAEVLKVEPPDGEASRAWPPHQDGQGYFFTINNANKRSLRLDLRAAADRAAFTGLLSRADVLVENLKPGSLARLGFDPAALAALNPRLVYCAISGFGRTSAYPGRPAFDTVVQAMSGLMDVTRAGEVPVKLGTSVADVTGGIAGLFAILCALEQRRRTGRGSAVDLAMQDVAVFLTQTAWNGAAQPPHCVIACADGHVVAGADLSTLADAAATAAGTTRAALVAALAARGIAAVPVRTLTEIRNDPAIVGDGAVALYEGADGKTWPLFRSPFRFSAVPPVPLSAIGPLGEANAGLAARSAGGGTRGTAE